MKKILLIVLIIFCCLSLSSCQVIDAFNALKYSISGDVIDPVDSFSRGEESGTFIYKDNKYILVEEINGDCEIDITEQDILLGQRSNFPFFPNFRYYVNPNENPDFIMGSNSSVPVGTFVYLREDLYSDNIVYVLNNGSYEFEFSAAFTKSDQVDYDFDEDIRNNPDIKYASIDFYMKEIPTITGRKRIDLIDNAWCWTDGGEAYKLPDEFVSKLTEAGIID